MITFYTTAKPFVGVTRVHQFNAIRSWRRVHPGVEVILFGAGDGYGQAAKELGLKWVADVETGPTGVPRIDAMAARVERDAAHERRAYVNCDVILLGAFAAAAGRVPFDRYLMVSRRWNLDVAHEIDLSAPDWDEHLRDAVRQRGELFTSWGIDVFLYRGDVWGELPPMVVGRAGYDNWLLYRCASRRVPLVDATPAMSVVHQNHDYGHLPGGARETFSGVEARENLRLSAGPRYRFTVDDAGWQTDGRRLGRSWCRQDSRRCAEIFRIVREHHGLLGSRPAEAVAEVVYELRVRASQTRAGAWRPLFKFPGWLVRWLFGRRFGRANSTAATGHGAAEGDRGPRE
jgi:hypothetical protein